MKIYINTAIILLAGLAISACAPVNTKQLIPETPTNVRNFQLELGVAPVKGGSEENPARYRGVINKDMKGPVFQSAIIETLTKARMFQSVALNKSQRYVLFPQITFQETDFSRVGGGSFTYILIVKYTIKDGASNKVIYEKQFTSACLKKISDALGGAARFNMALGCSVKSNLSKLLIDLNRRLKV